MKYAQAAWRIFLAWLAKRAHLPQGFVWDLEDVASLAMFECSRDFEPVEVKTPGAWRCEHMSLAGSSLVGTPRCMYGCQMEPIMGELTR